MITLGPPRRVQATQRAGRAGRTRHGRCYRLYTQRFFEADMPEATVPEIQRTSMLAAVLYLKSLPLDIDVLAFDYLDSPGVRACGLPAHRVLSAGIRNVLCPSVARTAHHVVARPVLRGW